MSNLFCVECGFIEAPNFTRIMHSVVLIAETEAEALQYAVQLCPEAFAECLEHRVVQINHLIIDYATGDTVLKEKRSKEFHC